MLRITQEQRCFLLQYHRCALVSAPSQHLFPFFSCRCCGHPSLLHSSPSSLHLPLSAISRQLTWVQYKMPAPSESGQAARRPGWTLLTSSPIYFNLGTATSHCLRPGSLETQLSAGVVLGSCPSVLDWGWNSSSCSVVFPTAAAPHSELGAAEAPGQRSYAGPSRLRDAGSSSWQWQCRVVTQVLSGAKTAVASHGS